MVHANNGEGGEERDRARGAPGRGLRRAPPDTTVRADDCRDRPDQSKQGQRVGDCSEHRENRQGREFELRSRSSGHGRFIGRADSRLKAGPCTSRCRRLGECLGMTPERWPGQANDGSANMSTQNALSAGAAAVRLTLLMLIVFGVVITTVALNRGSHVCNPRVAGLDPRLKQCRRRSPT